MRVALILFVIFWTSLSICGFLVLYAVYKNESRNWVDTIGLIYLFLQSILVLYGIIDVFKKAKKDANS